MARQHAMNAPAPDDRRGSRAVPRRASRNRRFGAMLCGLLAVVLPGEGGSNLAAEVAAGSLLPADDGSELARQPTWTIPTRDEVESRLLGWIDATVAPEGRAAALEAWQNRAGGDLLDAVMASIAAADPRCLPVLAIVPATPGVPPLTAATLPPWVEDPATADFEREAVRLWLGRELVRQERYDDGLALLEGLEVADSIDPSALLFHTAACQHWLLRADDAVITLDRLLERADAIPVRYERVARLLRADMATLEDESLDHIARRMRDITRRLGLGRAGPGTRKVQDGVIESLDKLIAAIEEQQNQQSGGGGAPGSGKSGNGKPMDDSRIAGGQGPGEVTRRDLGDGEGWGNLPPHEREQALQQIGREFPPHYREAIEQYFKRLATGEPSP